MPARRIFRATPTSAAGSTRESGEYRVWLWRSRSMKGAARWPLRLKACARGPPRALVGPGLDIETVIVESKLGILRDRVLVGGREIAVHRGRHGWRLVAVARGGVGRVQYDGWRDRLTIQSPSGSLEIRFRWRNTTFPWRGRGYPVGAVLGHPVAGLRGRGPGPVGQNPLGGRPVQVQEPGVPRHQ